MEKKTEPWHLSRSINVAHILVVLTLFISGFVYVSNIKEDVALHEQQIAHNTESIKNGKSEMHQITKQINSKLDKIFDMLYELGKN